MEAAGRERLSLVVHFRWHPEALAVMEVLVIMEVNGTLRGFA
jgi:hypothetical protein